MRATNALLFTSLLGVVLVLGGAAPGDVGGSPLIGSGSKFLFKPKAGTDQTVVVMVSPGGTESDTTIRYYLDKSARTPGTLSTTTIAVVGSSDPSRLLALFEPLEDPAVLPRAVFENAAGLPLAESLLSNPGALAPYRVGTSTILVPAGYLKCAQYRVSRDGQTIDFWVNDRAGPLGLVQLNSTGPEPGQNFEVILLSLLSTHR